MTRTTSSSDGYNTATLEEGVLLALSDWQGSVAQARVQGKARRVGLIEAIRKDATAFDFVREIFSALSLPRSAQGRGEKLVGLARNAPAAMPASLRAALQVGTVAGMGVAWGAVPLLKQRLRSHLKDLVVTLNDESSLVSATEGQFRKNYRVIGSRVFGPEGSNREALRLAKLVAEGGLENLTLDIATFVPDFTAWQHDEIVAHTPSALLKLCDAVQNGDAELTLTASDYQSALVIPEIVMAILKKDRYRDLKLGFVLFIDLPETQDIILKLKDYIADHRAQTNTPLKVTLTDRSFSHTQQVMSTEEGLPVPNITDQSGRDTNFSVALATLLDKNMAGVSTVVETVDPVYAAFSRTYANLTAVADRLTLQLRRGLSQELLIALEQQNTSGRIYLSTPITRRSDFQNTLPEVLEMLALAVDPEGAFEASNILFEGDEITGAEAREQLRPRVKRLIAETKAQPPASHRIQRRDLEWTPETKDTALFYKPPTEAHQFDTGGLTAAVLSLQKQHTGELVLLPKGPAQSVPVVSPSGFANEPDSDVTRAENRLWFRTLVEDSKYGTKTRANHTGQSPQEDAPKPLSATETTRVLKRVALALVAARDRIIEAITIDRGTPLKEIDSEINRAVDAVRYISHRAGALRVQRGAEFQPDEKILIAADNRATFSAITEAVTAALAVGSKVHILTAEIMARSIGVLIDELYQGGIPKGSIKHSIAEHEKFEKTLRDLLTSQETAEGVKRVITLCHENFADAVRKWRPDLIREPRYSSGMGTLILTAGGDRVSAIRDLINSAFLNSGAHPQKIAALIIAGDIYKKERFFSDLKDAVHALRVGRSGHSETDSLALNVGPLPRRPVGEELRALTELAPGEEWLVAPRQLDSAGLLWSPGVRTGVKPDSWFWRAAATVPVIGVCIRSNFADALWAQNQINSGSVAALYAESADLKREWIASSFAASLFLDKATCGAKIERAPVGNWARNETAPLALVGGPNRLIGLGTWRLRPGAQSETLHLRGLGERVQALIESAQRHLGYDEFDILRRAALADVLSYKTQYGVVKELTQLHNEHNFLRYQRSSVHIRAMADVSLLDFLRVVIAAIVSKSDFTVSIANELPSNLSQLIEQLTGNVLVESDEDWLSRAATQGSEITHDLHTERIRLVGGDSVRVREWLSSKTDVSVIAEPVTMAGSIELFGFFREQAISINMVRGGYVLEDEELISFFSSE